MTIYIIEIGLFLAFVLLFVNKGSRLYNKKYFLFFTFMMLALVLGLRNPTTVGEDTDTYVQIFNIAKNMRWSEVLTNKFRIAYFSGSGLQSIEPGWMVICKITSALGVGAQGFILLISVLTCALFANFILHNCKNVHFSAYVFMCESLYMNSFNLARQIFAISICINAYTCLKNRKIASALWLIIISTFIHNSSVVFLLMFPVVLIKSQKVNKYFKYVMFACVILPFLLPSIKRVLEIILPRYAGYFSMQLWNNSVGGTLVFWGVELLFVFIMYRKRFSAEKDDYDYASFTLLYFILEILSFQITIFTRIAMSFRAFLICFLPNTCEYVPIRYRKIYSFALYMLLTISFLRYASLGVRQYQFFWQ